MMQKHITSNIYPSSDQEFECSRCHKKVKRMDYVHDDKLCHTCFEMDEVVKEPVEPQ